MRTVVVVTKSDDWLNSLRGAEVVEAKKYLTDSVFAHTPSLRVFNLCRSLSYQSLGYYVSLLAMARGHRIFPGLTAVLDLKSPSLVKHLGAELEDIVQRSLKPLQADQFTLSVYFGKNLAHRYDDLSRRLFTLFEAPLLKFLFIKKSDHWFLSRATVIATDDVPKDHRPFVQEAFEEFFKKNRSLRKTKNKPAPSLAILVNPSEENAPSNKAALKKFEKSFSNRGFQVDVITKEEAAIIGAYDALFIRETTQVNHHTYRIARKAVAEGVVVIDDPESIIRCTNKVYLNEILDLKKIPTPKSWILSKLNFSKMRDSLEYPCILKLPDSAFSLGVKKASDKDEFTRTAEAFLDQSDLLIVQEYLPSEFDWRIGLIDGKAFYACRYFMASGHWQILKSDGPASTTSEGKVECVPLNKVPTQAIELAEKSAALIGDSLYGVDIKETKKGFCVIEINDNPSIDSGYEDQVIGDKLYDKVADAFAKRLQHIKFERKKNS